MGQGTRIKNEASRQAWNKRLRNNQLGTVTSAALLTEIAHDLNYTVFSVEDKASGQTLSYSEREMLAFYIFSAAIGKDWEKPDDPRNNPFADRTYEAFVTSPDSAWASQIDGIMDRSVLGELVVGQLKAISQRISEETNPVLIARYQDARVEIIAKYVRSVIRNREMADFVVNLVSEKSDQDVQNLLRGEGADAKELIKQFNEFAKNQTATTLSSGLYNGRAFNIVEIIDRISRAIQPAQPAAVIAQGEVAKAAGSGLVSDSFSLPERDALIQKRKRGPMGQSDLRSAGIVSAIMQTQVEPEVVTDLEFLKQKAFEQKTAVVMSGVRTRGTYNVYGTVQDRIKAGNPDYVIGDITDIVGARMIAGDLVSLEKMMKIIEQEYGVRIIEKRNGYAGDEASTTPVRQVSYLVKTKNGNNMFYIELKTEQAMVANDLFARYGRSNESVADYAWTSLQNEMSQYLDEVHGQSPGYLGLLTDGLPVVSRIRAALAEGRQSGQAGSVAILGAPGSGKTEQLLAALKKDVPVFDLRNLFLEGRDESDYDRYKTDMELKREETEWLKDQVARWKAGQENKLSAVLDTDTDTLIFDEFEDVHFY